MAFFFGIITMLIGGYTILNQGPEFQDPQFPQRLLSRSGRMRPLSPWRLPWQPWLPPSLLSSRRPRRAGAAWHYLAITHGYLDQLGRQAKWPVGHYVAGISAATGGILAMTTRG